MRPSLYSWINPSARLAVLIVLLILMGAVFAALSFIGAPLNNDTAPCGIVSLELAGSESRADRIVCSWAENGLPSAFLNTGLDYLFLCIYPLALSLACCLLAERGGGFKKAGLSLSFMVLLAAPLDAVEDYGLLRMLNWTGGEVWPAVAKWCAIPKFTLAILGTVYIVMAGAIWIRRKLARPAARVASPAG